MCVCVWVLGSKLLPASSMQPPAWRARPLVRPGCNAEPCARQRAGRLVSSCPALANTRQAGFRVWPLVPGWGAGAALSYRLPVVCWRYWVGGGVGTGA